MSEPIVAFLVSVGILACLIFVALLAGTSVMVVRSWWQHRQDVAYGESLVCTCARDRNLPPSEAPCLRHDP